MKLQYLGMGKRFYGNRFLPCYQRKRWEYQVILNGRCTLRRRVDGEEEQLDLDAEKCGIGVICGPESWHSWLGKKGDECEVAVFQFSEIDSDLASIVGAQGCKMMDLDANELDAVRQWLHRCISESATSRPFIQCIHEIVQAELALLFLRKHYEGVAEEKDLAGMKVEKAMEWYRANLESFPGVREVSDAVHVSPAHLRRIFHRVRGKAPQQVMEEIRFERALQWMRDSATTLEVVAEQAGFGSASAFSRAFKKRYAQSPAVYRREVRLLEGNLSNEKT